ncbi:iron-containing redox enzyme family protein [Mycobacterium sp. NPDC003323]
MGVSPPLPAPAGPISAALIAQLSGRVQDLTRVRPDRADPMGRDVQLALFVTYELSCRGFAGTDPDWESDPDLIGLRGRLERVFCDHLRHCVGDISDVSAPAELCRLAGEPPDDPEHDSPHESPAHFLCSIGSRQQMCEYLVHRSPYHLKAADAQAWVLPRLTAAPKAALAEVHYAHLHRRPYTQVMAAAGLDDGYLAYLHTVPAESLAVVNLMSMFGLHRSMRGAALGHLSATEITTRAVDRRLVQALRRLDAPPQCADFYAERAYAAPGRGQVVDHLLSTEPDLEGDVVFGIRARDVVEGRLAEHMVKCWADGDTSLLRPL